MCGKWIYTYANRLDSCQPPNNPAADLRSNLFATQSTIPNKKTIISKFVGADISMYILRKLPSIQRVKYFYRAVSTTQ